MDLKLGGGTRAEALKKYESLQNDHFPKKVVICDTKEEFFGVEGEVIKPRILDYGLVKFVEEEHPDVRVFTVLIYCTEHLPSRTIKDEADFEAASEWWQLLIAAEHYGVDCSDTAEYIRQQLCAYMREHGALV